MGRPDLLGGLRRRALVLPPLLVCVLTLVAVPGCGDDDGDVSAADLSGHLPPAQELQLAGELQLESERELEWDNATDFIAQGVFHSEGPRRRS